MTAQTYLVPAQRAELDTCGAEVGVLDVGRVVRKHKGHFVRLRCHFVQVHNKSKSLFDDENLELHCDLARAVEADRTGQHQGVVVQRKPAPVGGVRRTACIFADEVQGRQSELCAPKSWVSYDKAVKAIVLGEVPVVVVQLEHVGHELGPCAWKRLTG